MKNKLAGKHPSYDKLGMSEERKKKKMPMTRNTTSQRSVRTIGLI